MMSHSCRGLFREGQRMVPRGGPEKEHQNRVVGGLHRWDSLKKRTYPPSAEQNHFEEENDLPAAYAPLP